MALLAPSSRRPGEKPLKKRLLSLMLAGAAAAFAVSGCGDTSATEPEELATSSLTKKQYIQKGDQICKAGYRNVGKVLLGVEFNELSDKEKEEFMSDKALPPFKAMVERLRELGAPEGEKKEVEAVLEAYEKGIREVEDDPSRSFQGKLPFDKGNNTAYRYGLRVCAGLSS
ncbi:MAG TPA: hypothetical protein VFP17_02205 [Solirubrobacterales bacterium]|nr:hypothetical protein [Solirubrobacterales bacterium]